MPPADDNAAPSSAQLKDRNRAGRAGFEAATNDTIAKFIEPFADTFASLHDVTVAGLPTTDVIPELDELDGEVLEDATALVEAFVEGGTSREVAAEIMRGAVGIASNRALIKGILQAVPRDVPKPLVGRLSAGVTAVRTNIPAYVAQGREFLGRTGRTLARNRTKLIYAGAFVGAATLIAWAIKEDKADRDKALAALRQQRHYEVAAHQAQLLNERNQAELLFATERIEQATEALSLLTDAGLSRLPGLRDLVAGSDDYSSCPLPDRRTVVEVVALAQAAAGVIASTRRTDVAHSAHEDEAHTRLLHAAQQILNRYSPQRRLNPHSTGTALAAATAATLNTTTHRSQLKYLLQQRSYLESLSKRCINVHDGIRAGFFFELLQTMGFNLDAVSKDSDLRAEMTERLGRPHDPVDIEITNETGSVVDRVQAKVVDSKYHRIGLKNGIADPKYGGQTRLIPADQLVETHTALDNALARSPENIYTPNYLDAKEHVTDVISIGDISSDPLTNGQINKAANDPNGFILRLLSDNRREQAINAGLTAGATATSSAFATDVSGHLLIEGHLDGREWTQASVAAARTGVTAAFAASASNYLQTGAIQATDDGTATAFQSSLAHGDHGPAFTQAAVRIAAIVQGVVTEQLTPAQGALATAEAITQSAAIWACTYAARKAIRDPETAAIVAGLAGQIASQLVSQGIQIAVLGRDPNPRWDDAYEALLADTDALEAAYEAERTELAELTAQARARYVDQVRPLLERLDATYGPESVLSDLLFIADHFSTTALFATLDEFDVFMADQATTLVLVLGHS